MTTSKNSPKSVSLLALWFWFLGGGSAYHPEWDATEEDAKDNELWEDNWDDDNVDDDFSKQLRCVRRDAAEY